MKTPNKPGHPKRRPAWPAMRSAGPGLQDQACDALCHMGAALSVLELQARCAPCATVCALRDLLGTYCRRAERAVAQLPAHGQAEGTLQQMAGDLGYALALLDKVNDGERDDEVLYAVGYLLKAARRLVAAVAPPAPASPP
nr:hypothetical protein H9T68_20665 [Delftia sp. PS-11]